MHGVNHLEAMLNNAGRIQILIKLDEDCFIQGMKWRFLRAKGLIILRGEKAYDEDCIRVLSRDGGARICLLFGNEGVPFISMAMFLMRVWGVNEREVTRII